MSPDVFPSIFVFFEEPAHIVGGMSPTRGKHLPRLVLSGSERYSVPPSTGCSEAAPSQRAIVGVVDVVLGLKIPAVTDFLKLLSYC
jgi:hypothetical protein